MKQKSKLPVPEELDTVWELPDAAWERIDPIIKEHTPWGKRGPKPWIDFRQALNGIIFRLRSGCQWNKLPKEFGDDSRIHHWFQVWCRSGVFERIWAALVEECAELDGVDWEWQSADGCMNKARFGGEKNRPESNGQRKARGKEEHSGGGRRWPSSRGD